MANVRPASGPDARIVAVLGPTNTGKTHLAMERMLGHASGMIGFPLRLLARENYERAVKLKGPARVALITGEEKIVPPGACWFLCTVEAMPIDRRVAFLGIDEIQMCADPDRGHLFTHRLLHARGELETMFMGAETIRPLLRLLVPEAEFITRPRFSALTNAGTCKLTRLPRRTAIVAFSAADVYGIAELVRRQRGGAAIVLGALSPRTRNAQVAMYQAGEVDYLVATDAIGMGLNMNVDHVAFAATRKFDGRVPRSLTASEMAQIAGRAGRHTRDGTFGTTAEVGPLDPSWPSASKATPSSRSGRCSGGTTNSALPRSKRCAPAWTAHRAGRDWSGRAKPTTNWRWPILPGMRRSPAGPAALPRWPFCGRCAAFRISARSPARGTPGCWRRSSVS